MVRGGFEGNGLVWTQGLGTGIGVKEYGLGWMRVLDNSKGWVLSSRKLASVCIKLLKISHQYKLLLCLALSPFVSIIKKYFCFHVNECQPALYFALGYFFVVCYFILYNLFLIEDNNGFFDL